MHVDATLTTIDDSKATKLKICTHLQGSTPNDTAPSPKPTTRCDAPIMWCVGVPFEPPVRSRRPVATTPRSLPSTHDGDATVRQLRPCDSWLRAPWPANPSVLSGRLPAQAAAQAPPCVSADAPVPGDAVRPAVVATAPAPPAAGGGGVALDPGLPAPGREQRRMATMMDLTGATVVTEAPGAPGSDSSSDYSDADVARTDSALQLQCGTAATPHVGGDADSDSDSDSDSSDTDGTGCSVYTVTSSEGEEGADTRPHPVCTPRAVGVSDVGMLLDTLVR